MSGGDLNQKGWRGHNDIAITIKKAQPDVMFKKFDQSQINKYNFFARASGIKWKRCYFAQGLYSEFWTSSDATEKDAFNRTLAYSWWNVHKGEIYRTTLSKN